MTGATRKKNAHVWARDPHDWYVEDYRASAALFRVETFEGAIYDPACGKGNICRAAIAAGIKAYGTDLVDRHPFAPDWYAGELDFLHEKIPPARNIVTNPPFYKGAGTENFIKRALHVARNKVAIFTTLTFLASQKRAKGLFASTPPTRVWIVTPRVSCPPGAYLEAGGKAAGDQKDWCWLVWNLDDDSYQTELKWLNVNEE